MRKRAITHIDVLVVVTLLVVLMLMHPILRVLPVLFLGRGYGQAHRSSCASNLSQIYKAMNIYSQDYQGMFPSIPLGRGHLVGEDKADRNLRPNAPDNPFKDFAPDANHSVSQNLWLLVRGDFAQPEIFLCPSAPWAEEKLDRKVDGPDGEYGNFVSFPWKDPATTISYSFIQPWSRFADNHSTAELWGVDADPRVVLGADANNGKQPEFQGPGGRSDFPDIKKYVNSTNHKGEGQNLLYGDGHVAWSQTAYAGIDNDNVYTALPPDYTGNPGDSPGILSVRPRDPFGPKANKPLEWDSVLLPNKDAELERWNRNP